MDPANLPATFFAILSLGFVGDLEGVKRKECLRWLRSLQRKDGSFGELITQDGEIEGGRDMRLSYVATAIRWMLRGDGEGEEEDIDIEALVNFLRAGQVCVGFLLKEFELIGEGRLMMVGYRNLQSMKLMVCPQFQVSEK